MVEYIINNTDGSKSSVKAVDAVKTFSPTLEAGVAAGDFVYKNESSGKWDKFEFPGVTILGLGVVDGDLNVVHFGIIEGLSGLTADTDYYAESGVAGSLSDTVSDIKVMRTRSTTEALVNINVEGSSKSSHFVLVTDDYGYIGGGYTVTSVNNVDQLTFSNSNISANSSTLTGPARFTGGFGDASAYGYFGGGESIGVADYIDTVDRLSFSSFNITSNSSTLTQAKMGLGGLGDSGVVGYGYFGGGTTAVEIDTVDRLTFSDSIIAANASQITESRYFLATFGDTSTYGYFGGGYTGDDIIKVDRLTFSSSNISANVSNLTGVRRGEGGLGDSGVVGYGYFGGGRFPDSNLVDRLTFSSSNISANSSTLTSARAYGSGIGDSSIYGYFGGGTGGIGDRVDRLTFSNSNISINASTLTTILEDVTGLSLEP